MVCVQPKFNGPRIHHIITGNGSNSNNFRVRLSFTFRQQLKIDIKSTILQDDCIPRKQNFDIVY